MNVTDYMNFELILFGRVDQHDRNRTHGDIREAFFELFFDEWTLGFGIHKVFWGVTESRHLVDIINQTDLVENTDGEDKLGQPMLNLALIGDYGTVDLFVLPYFRERTFAGADGRPGRWRVADELAVFGSVNARFLRPVLDEDSPFHGLEPWRPGREARAEAERENMDRIGQYLAGDAVFSLAHSK